MAVVIEDIEQEDVVTEQRARRQAHRLPAGRIVFVPFSLVEVEMVPEDE